ncbi:hypothetical protein JCM18382A_37120 [Bradyrhizobium sp. 17-4]
MLIDAGIVDDDVERAVLRHHGMHRRGIADIEPRDAGTGFAREFGRRSHVEIGDYDSGARGGKAANDRSSNAARPAGNEGTAAVEASEWQGRHLSAP